MAISQRTHASCTCSSQGARVRSHLAVERAACLSTARSGALAHTGALTKRSDKTASFTMKYDSEYCITDAKSPEKWVEHNE